MSRFPAWAKVTLTVVTVVVLVISTFVVFVVGQLSGGFGARVPSTTGPECE